MQTSNELHLLVRSVSKLISPHQYGHIRKKLVKQGFSEILLYKAVADHCEENFIDPVTMAEDMKDVLDGCGRNMNFLNTSNLFPFLRGMFHQLRIGNVQLSEPKCPEQKGLFLCNCCHRVLGKDIRSRQKTTPNTCRPCISEQVKERKRQADVANLKLASKFPETSDEPIEEEEPIVIDTPVDVVEETQEPTIEITPIKQDKPMTQPIVETPEVIESIRITEVIADERSASVTVTCSPKELYLVLSALSQVTS